jgi:hypothetical protein
MENFLPPTELEVRQSIERILRKRASEACYWKEDFENKSANTDQLYWRQHYSESAIRLAEIENLWNEAADIASGKRKE